MSGGCGKGLYFWKPLIEENTSMYLYVGFGKFMGIINFGIYFLVKKLQKIAEIIFKP
jgi:hypothetical protein